MTGKAAKVVVVLPAYNAERTLGRIFRQIPKRVVDDILLVDDGSKDKTSEISQKLGIRTIVHPKNMGYGANQKTCYKNALKMGADYVIMLHPDGQYDPKDLSKFIKVFKSGKADLVLGSRFLSKKGDETPFYKSFSIRIITFLFNAILGTKLSEANTGYRGYSRKVLGAIPFMKNGNDYIFDPQALIQTVYFGFRIKDVPVAKKYNPERIEPNFQKSVQHGLENIKLLLQYILHKWNIRKAEFLVLLN